MADKIKLRRDTAANWTTNNPILEEGEMGLELDTKKIKMGDGVTAWNSLSYNWTLNAMLPTQTGNAGKYLVTDGSDPSWSELSGMAKQDPAAVNITGGVITGIQDLAIADGGTGASDASTARTNLGLGTVATQNSNAVSITGGSITGCTITNNINGNATTVTNGVYTVGDQTIAGTKTFSSTISGSINGNAATSTNATNHIADVTGAVHGATSTNTANMIVRRDASGNFSAGTITAALNGNAVTVTNGVYTVGDQTIAGVKTFSSTISGSINGNAATSTNATNHIADTSGAVHGATSTNTGNMIVRRDASGNFSAGTITATLNGNASTATSLSGYNMGNRNVTISTGDPSGGASGDVWLKYF